MEQWYLVGEPLLDPKFRENYLAPIGQVDICLKILKEVKSEEQALQILREEYLAIVYALREMGINFRIIYAHKDNIDLKTLGACVKLLGCRLVGFPPGFIPQAVIYPRDLFTVFPNFVLVNSEIVEVLTDAKGDYHIISSLYGEGGRVLASQRTILVPEGLNLKEGCTIQTTGLDELEKLGIKTGLLPMPLAQSFSAQGREDEIISYDHLDRTFALLEDQKNNLHLLVDPLICTTQWQNSSWAPHYPQESLETIRKRCEPLMIEVHCPRQIKVPYSLNFLQFPDKRVLMTAGDDSVEELVADIVGRKNVFKTPTPIKLLPIFQYAGIRCLLNEAPAPLFKSQISEAQASPV